MSDSYLQKVDEWLAIAQLALMAGEAEDHGPLSSRLEEARMRVRKLRGSRGEALDLPVAPATLTSIRRAIAFAIALLRARPVPLPVEETLLLSKLVVIQTELHTPKYAHIP